MLFGLSLLRAYLPPSWQLLNWMIKRSSRRLGEACGACGLDARALACCEGLRSHVGAHETVCARQAREECALPLAAVPAAAREDTKVSKDDA